MDIKNNINNFNNFIKYGNFLIENPYNGLIKFEPTLVQEDIISLINNKENIISSFPRQFGLTTIISFKIAYDLIFGKKEKILLITDKHVTSKTIKKRVIRIIKSFLQNNEKNIKVKKSSDEIIVGNNILILLTPRMSLRGHSTFDKVYIDTIHHISLNILGNFLKELDIIIDDDTLLKFFSTGFFKETDIIYEEFRDFFKKYNITNISLKQLDTWKDWKRLILERWNNIKEYFTEEEFKNQYLCSFKNV
jgi:hypothetical protein